MKRLFFLLFLALFVSASLTTGCTSQTPSEQTDGDGGTKDGGAKFKALSADGYTTVSDVNSHNKVPADIGEIKALLDKSPVDWDAVQKMYEKGKHSVKGDGSVRTLNGFASKPDNFKKYSPDASAYFATNNICKLEPVQDFKCTDGKFLDELIEFYAMKGTGPFKGASDAIRGAVVKAGLLVNMHYWVRLEFGKAIGKAKDGNVEPLKGAPHNWDEAFAFYWGPEGKDSLYALAAELSSKHKLGTSINKAFFESLVAGLKVMTDDKKEPQADTDKATKQLHRLFILALLDTAKAMDDTSDADARLVLRWKGFAYWHAVGHLFAADSNADTALKDVFFTGKVTKDFAAAVQKAVSDNLSKLGYTKDDFGTALP